MISSQLLSFPHRPSSPSFLCIVIKSGLLFYIWFRIVEDGLGRKWAESQRSLKCRLIPDDDCRLSITRRSYLYQSKGMYGGKDNAHKDV